MPILRSFVPGGRRLPMVAVAEDVPVTRLAGGKGPDESFPWSLAVRSPAAKSCYGNPSASIRSLRPREGKSMYGRILVAVD